MRRAEFWEAGEGETVRCRLCRFGCLIAEGRRGRCGVRENGHGILYTLVHGRCVAEQVDPVEKKPLFHFQPGSRTFSIATVGCNFHCRHCQNYTISQLPHSTGKIVGENLPPAEVVHRAVTAGCRSIAYTYTEPTVYFEYAYDCAVLAKQAGLRNLFVSNGYTESAPLEAIAPFLDAANIDLKSFNAKTHRELTGGELAGVLATLRDYRRLGIWLEVTTLLIPGVNDSDDELKSLANFVRDELGHATPWHVSAFHPCYRMLDRPPTPLATLQRAYDIGRAAGLHYVYCGNRPGRGGEDTCCPVCGALVIGRNGFQLTGIALAAGGHCARCGAAIPGIDLS